MARNIETIQTGINTDIANSPVLNPGGAGPNLQSASKRAFWNAITFIVATAINILENIMDVFKADVETTASSAAAASAAWLQEKAFEFQYDADNPQVIQLINTVPVYPVVDPTLRITTRCSISTTLSNQSLIKVAKHNPPVGFVDDELSAIQSYFNIIGGGGIEYILSSGNADQMYIGADVYFDGQYRAVILANLTAAITNYFANLSANDFNGNILMSAIENVIRNTTGVNDVVLKNVLARKDATLFADATYLIQDNTIISRLWAPVAGYVVPETTSGETLADSLNLIAQ